MTKSTFSAADPTLGYLYQVRVALLWALRRMRAGSDFLISLETLDDVTFEAIGAGSPPDLLQTKHHRSREAALTDASPDLWKSLRIYFDGHATKSIPAGANFHLMTTGIAPEGSAASKLRFSSRDVDAAISLLTTTAQSSQSKANAAAYAAFLKESVAVRKTIVDSLIVLDGAPTIAGLDADLRTEVFWAAEKGHHDAFLERLEGWWLRRIIKQLHTTGDRVLSAEVETQMSDLREQFKQDALPIDDDLLEFVLDEATEAAHASSTFVRQLELVKAGKKRIAAAIRDFYRAFEQRSRWLRNELLMIGELEKYAKRLTEEWELVFAAMKDELGAEAADEAKEKAARSVLQWAERIALPIRPNVTEPFVVRGSLHLLADDLRIGWHPEFRDRLAKVLKPAEE